MEKLIKITKKMGVEGYMITDDPDAEVDFGVDENDYIIINSEPTMFKIDDLNYIKYRFLGEGFEYDENQYIHFLFKNNCDLFIYYNSDQSCGFGERLELNYNGKNFYHYAICDAIIHATHKGWNGTDEMVITKDGDLVGYLGEDKNIVIPEGVRKIGWGVFIFSDIESVVLPNSLKVIDNYAFSGTKRLKRINLPQIDEIGWGAFKGSGIETITLTSTLTKLGKEAFFSSGITSLDKIKNNSSLPLDEAFTDED